MLFSGSGVGAVLDEYRSGLRAPLARLGGLKAYGILRPFGRHRGGIDLQQTDRLFLGVLVVHLAKDDAAQWLVEGYVEVEPYLSEVYRIRSRPPLSRPAERPGAPKAAQEKPAAVVSSR